VILGANLGIAVAHATIRSCRHRIPVQRWVARESTELHILAKARFLVELVTSSLGEVLELFKLTKADGFLNVTICRNIYFKQTLTYSLLLDFSEEKWLGHYCMCTFSVHSLSSMNEFNSLATDKHIFRSHVRQ